MNKGFTLVETMVVVFIFTLIIGAIFAAMNVSRQSWLMGNSQLEVQQEVREAMTWMVRELSQSGTDYSPMFAQRIGLPADGNPYNMITFRIAEDIDNDGDVFDVNGDKEWGNQITYLHDLNAQQLLRLSGGSTYVLADRVVGLQFVASSFDDPTPLNVNSGDETIRIVEITLQTQRDVLQGRTAQATLTSEATLRNN